jgi:hypothetical protein
MEVVGHHTNTNKAHGDAGAAGPQRRHDGVAVIGIVKHARPLVAAIEGMVAIAACRGSERARHDLIVAHRLRRGKPKLNCIRKRGHAVSKMTNTEMGV